MEKKAFVLLSGGLDSTTALYLASKNFLALEAVSFDYGQRHRKEMEYARKSCDVLDIKHTILSLGGLLSGEGVMLTDSAVEVPNIAYSDIQGVSPTYVPFRNGTMLSCIAALANKYVMQQIDEEVKRTSDVITNPMEAKMVATINAKDLVTIYAGQHAEDAANWAYPDCTFEFLGSMANAIYQGTYNTVRLSVPFVFMEKHEIVELGNKLGVPYENSWSCYKGEQWHCGVCPTCRSRKEAFKRADVFDPTVYTE